jgi:peptidoglycan DL-endopeptidase CwlO
LDLSGASIVAEAKKFVGDPYAYGAAGPSSFDCSGLVQYVLTQLGVKSVPRTSEAQWGWVTKISRSQLQPGDLIFEQWGGGTTPPRPRGI